MSINKAWYSHKKGCHAARERNEEALYVLLWNELQDKPIRKHSAQGGWNGALCVYAQKYVKGDTNF